MLATEAEVDTSQCATSPVSKEQWGWRFLDMGLPHDHVHLKKEHIPTLQAAFTQTSLDAGFGEFPYVPFCMKCPWYAFVGQKTLSRARPWSE